MEQLYPSCEICDLHYSNHRHPRNLPCGHAVCTSCLEQILIRESKCPECRSDLVSQVASEFPVNYPILRMCNNLIVTEGSSMNVLEDFKSSYRGDLKRSLMQANQIKEKLDSEYSSIVNCTLDLERKLKKGKVEIEKTRSVLKEIYLNQKEVVPKIASIKTIIDMLEASKSSMEQANSVKEMTTVIHHVANHKAELDTFKLQWMAAENILTQALFERKMAFFSQADKRDLLRRAVKGGQRVYATITKDDKLRFAEVKLQDRRILLFSLRDGSPPLEGLKIPYDMVRTLADETNPMVFLEIVMNGIAQGKIYIKLLDRAGRTLQFQYFCTGEKGPSYANTRFFEIVSGDKGNKIWGGDYENNDGTGGAALPGMTRGPEHYETIIPGLVCGFYFQGYGDDHNPSQFCIYIEKLGGIPDMSSLGNVVTGLHIAKAISRMESGCDARVSDCGMMLYSA